MLVAIIVFNEINADSAESRQPISDFLAIVFWAEPRLENATG